MRTLNVELANAPKAHLSILYHCGCGFRCDNAERAIVHCEVKGHTMTVSGSVTLAQAPKGKVA